MLPSQKIPQVVKLLFLIDIGLCAVYAINKLLGPSSEILTRLLNINHESSLASWYSSTQLFCVFILSAIFFYQKKLKGAQIFPLVFLPLSFLLMSIDENVQIHEWLGEMSDNLLPSGNRAESSFKKTGIWMFVMGIPFLIFFLICANLVRSHFSEKPFAFKKLVGGMMIMLIGALGFEALGNFVGPGFRTITFIVEEGLEMIGVTVMFWGIYDMVKDDLIIIDKKKKDINL